MPKKPERNNRHKNRPAHKADRRGNDSAPPAPSGRQKSGDKPALAPIRGERRSTRPAASPALRADASTRKQRQPLSGLGRRIGNDLRYFGIGRAMTIGRLVVTEAMRMRVWGIILIGLLAIVVGDLTTRHFDPVHDILPNLVRTSELTLAVLGVVVALFLSTFSLPHEMTTRTIYSLVTKPVSRLELLTGKFIGMAIVLGLLTLGLGLPTWIYMQVRSAQVQQMAAEQVEQYQTDSTSLETDLEPATLQAIADRGPLAARVFHEPTERLNIVSRIGGDDNRTWLSGAPNHMAHWGFEGLPVQELAEGRGKVVVRAEFADSEASTPLERREMLVRLLDDEAPPWSGSRVMNTEGVLEFDFPGIPQQGPVERPFAYTGGKLWVSMAGVSNPGLALGDDSCVIQVGNRTYTPQSGLRTTTSQTMGKFWLSAGQRFPGLLSRTRFGDLPVGTGGAQLQVDVTVPSAMDIPPQSRARLTLLNPDDASSRRELTFRPERRTSLLVDVPSEIMSGGKLDVYISTDDENVELGVTEMSVRMISGWRPLAWNWAKDLLMSWLVFCLVASIGLMFSTISGWYVASLATALVVVVAHVWQSILGMVRSYGLGFSGAGGHSHGGEAAEPSQVLRGIERAHEGMFQVLGRLLPDMGEMNFGDMVAMGINAPLGWLFALPYGVFWQTLLYVTIMLLLSYLLFVRKEVAQQ